MIYPASLIVISIVAVIYLFGFVLPGIFDTLSSSVTEMPAITAALKSFSDFIVAYRQHLIIFIFLGILLLITYGATEKGKRKMYKFMINMPIV
ncbi:hypothetical protein J6T66_06560 [bacterium]|nr:hypothetical protein [bacterium]